MKTCFSEGKLMKQYGNPSLSKSTPLSTNSPISEQLFHKPPFCPNFQNKNPPLILGGTMQCQDKFHLKIKGS